MAVRENTSLHGWMLLNYADLCDIGVEQALSMLCSAVSGGGSSGGGKAGGNGGSTVGGILGSGNGSGSGSIVFDDESVFVENTTTTTTCKVVMYNASLCNDSDVLVMQQMGVDGILNEPYTLDGLRECLKD